MNEVDVDNCCNLRFKFSHLFGQETKVTLDLFHSKARVIKTLSKGYSHYYECIADSRNVFRGDHDLGEKRSKSTPSIGSMF